MRKMPASGGMMVSACIVAGSLDSTKGLKTIGHVYVSQAGDYYEL